MCGRFSLSTAPEAMRALFDYENLPNIAPRYNIAPTQPVAVVRRTAGAGRELVTMRWGLVPRWAKDLSIGARLINARAETVAEKPAFRNALRWRRCLVPADGFYEWRREDGRRQPYRIARDDGGAFAFAGLWERWTAPAENAGAAVETVTIITTAADERLRPIHARMPAILDPADYGAWLDADAVPADRAQALLARARAPSLTITRIGPRINDVRHDDPDCLRPLDAAAGPG